MSETGHLVDATSSVQAIAVLRFDLHRGRRFAEHDHTEHQLAWAPDGVLTVEIGDQFWILPPTLALWIPAGVTHATSATRPTSMAGLYFAPQSCPITWSDPTVIVVRPLLRDLILHLEDRSLSAATRAHTEAVVCDLFRPVSVTTVHVPMPVDARAAEVANGVIARPADGRSVESWANEVGASVRTLSRLFTTETAMTFTQWRTHVRMRAALGHLADGMAIKSVAREVGYATTSAFVETFHRVTGQTPGAYFKP